jgi:uncharacterized protein
MSCVIHPSTELRYVNDVIGYGVFATDRIPQGTITWAGDDLDRAFSPEQFAAMAPPYQAIIERYGYTDNCGYHNLCWDIARYMNHSCEPTCVSLDYNLELAVRDIQPGEELTDDYGALNIDVAFECACGSARCRKRIVPEDLLAYADEWDAAAWPALQRITSVVQPLWWLVNQEDKDEIARVLAGEMSPTSCVKNYNAAAR